MASGGFALVLERYRADWNQGLTPFAQGLRRFGITPNTVTAASLLFAVGAFLSFLLADATRMWLLFLGAVLVAVAAILDGLDGRLARLTNNQTKRGDYLDHVVDRYSDVLILLGLTLSPLGDLRWGLLAIVGTFLTSYMGTQAQALGLGRNYGGWLGRADRLVILIAVPVLMWFAFAFGIALPAWLEPIDWMLIYFAVAGNITAIQRFWAGWKDLKE